MEPYHATYQKYPKSQPQSQQYMPVGYPISSMPPMMRTVHTPPMHHAMAPYGYAHPHAHPHVHGPSGPPKQQISTSSRIITEPGCMVLRSNRDATPIEHTARQIIAIDGKVFIEHIPAHNVIFVPVEVQPVTVIRQQVSGSRIIKARARHAPLARPSNVFFKYRSVKQRELQELNPRMNQTVISRMVAEHWKREPEEVKNRYKQEYKEDMKKYELFKKMNRSRPDYEYIDAGDLTTQSDTAASYFQRPSVQSQSSHSFVAEPRPLGLVQSEQPGSAGRHRSFTMPDLEKTQHNISQIIH
ncbi:hypothetical protein LPJ58_001227 [Coemansia sp. RSA 1591]|nr:hypothetical protein LPJ58_001227 [Coemansia sp. RSA 1591]KAJ2440272.1 hypothetical protein IWW46_004057 [Coemansia sp. RSA 2440]